MNPEDEGEEGDEPEGEDEDDAFELPPLQELLSHPILNHPAVREPLREAAADLGHAIASSPKGRALLQAGADWLSGRRIRQDRERKNR